MNGERGRPHTALVGHAAGLLVSDGDLCSPYEDDAEMRAIIVQYVEALEADVPRLATLADAGDFDGLARLAHRLKGSSKVLGFEAVGATFAALEDRAKVYAAECHGGSTAAAAVAAREELAGLVASCACFGEALMRRFFGDAGP